MKRFLIAILILWMIAVSVLLGYLLSCAQPPFQDEIKVYPTGSNTPSAYVLKEGKIWYMTVKYAHVVEFNEPEDN